MNQNAILGQLKKQVSHKGAKYGIGIAALCVVIIVIFVLMGNRGLVGTWETDEIVNGDWHTQNTIIFKKDNEAYITMKRLDMDYEEFCDLEWRHVDGSKYMITGESRGRQIETTIEIGSNEFVMEQDIFTDKKNIVYHRK